MSAALVWITGGSSGIGAALARTVPFAEARVIDVSRSGGTPGTVHHPADLADPASWLALGAHMRAELEQLEGDRVVLVHSAGTLDPIGFAGEVDGRAYQTNVLLNSAAPQVIGHTFLEALASTGYAGRADLVMLSSGAARKPYAGWSSYSAGKAAVDAWVIAVGKEQEERGGSVRVLSVTPGAVATPMQEQIRATSEESFPQRTKFADLYESGGLLEPEDAAARIWRLLDEDLLNGEVVDLRSR